MNASDILEPEDALDRHEQHFEGDAVIHVVGVFSPKFLTDAQSVVDRLFSQRSLIPVVVGHSVVAEDGNPDGRKDGEGDERRAGAHELLRGRGKAGDRRALRCAGMSGRRVARRPTPAPPWNSHGTRS